MSKSALDKVLTYMIDGAPGAWYYQFSICGIEFGGGMFHYKRDALINMRVQLRRSIAHDAMIITLVENHLD